MFKLLRVLLFGGIVAKPKLILQWIEVSNCLTLQFGESRLFDFHEFPIVLYTSDQRFKQSEYLP